MGNSEPLVELGPIVKRHGVRGEVRFFPHNPRSSVLTDLDEVAVIAIDGSVEWRRLSGMRPHKKFVLLRFEGVEDADQADQLIGRRVAVRRDQLPVLGGGEYYTIDLVGCVVETEEGKRLGIIEEVMETGSNQVFVVREGEREILVPFVVDVVLDVSIEKRRIVIDPIPGLLD